MLIGHRVTRKSYGSQRHLQLTVELYTTFAGATAQSSTESEWYAAISAAYDNEHGLVTFFMLPNCAEAALTTSGNNNSFPAVSWVFLCCHCWDDPFDHQGLEHRHFVVQSALEGGQGISQCRWLRRQCFDCVWIVIEYLQSFTAEHYFVDLAMMTQTQMSPIL